MTCQLHFSKIKICLKIKDQTSETQHKMLVILIRLLCFPNLGKGGRNLKEIKVKTGTKIDATR